MNRRNEILASLPEREFDLVVVGSGLLGASIALEAANAGFSVLIVDKDDFSAGSSSRTSKLAGAANYLHGSPFSLNPRVSTKQISDLYQRAPHMVKDFAFIMPVTGGGFIYSLQAQLALLWQDLSAGVLGKSRGHRRLNKKETLQAAPALAPNLVSGSLRFHDCFTDDSRFVLELLKAASENGAIAVNYMEAKEFECHDGEVRSVILRDRIGGQDLKVKPRAVVSACGAWTEPVAKLIAPEAELGESIKLLRSTHIVLPPSALETGSALLLPAEGNRFVFVVPWQRALLVGTTVSHFEGSPDTPVPTSQEITFLLDTINRYKRSGRSITGGDVACAWAGLNMVSSENNETFSLFRAANGVITGFGGHLTDIQKMSELAVHWITKKLGTTEASNAVRKKQMLGGFDDKQDFLTTTAEIAARARKLGLEPATLDHLISNYGKDALKVLDLIEERPALNERICADFPQLMAEVVHCVENEMAVSLEDVLCRRIRLGFLHREQCLDAAPRVAKMMQELCSWDSLRLKGELSNLARNLASQLAPVS